MEDALRINAAGLTRHQVKVERHLAPAASPVLTDKHKVLMILINLVSNAKYAMDGASGTGASRVKLERHRAERLRIEVRTTAWASHRSCSRASSSTASPPARRAMASACTPAPWRPRSWAAR